MPLPIAQLRARRKTLQQVNISDNNNTNNANTNNSGGGKPKPKRKIHKGPRGGKYYITKGRKVYV